MELWFITDANVFLENFCMDYQNAYHADFIGMEIMYAIWLLAMKINGQNMIRYRIHVCICPPAWLHFYKNKVTIS